MFEDVSILVMGRTVRFGLKFELGMKKNRIELSSIFYYSKIELENIS
jgi:hypothetical protein